MRPNARRIGALERRARQRRPASGGAQIRGYTSDQLSRLAAARRGELSDGEEAEVRAFWAAFERRAAEARGEGLT